MWDVVNDGRHGRRASSIAGFDIAGKTGTAQVVGLGKDVGENKDHAWFVSFAPAYKPEIAVIALIENVGFGGTLRRPGRPRASTTSTSRKAHPRPARPKHSPGDADRPARTSALRFRRAGC